MNTKAFEQASPRARLYALMDLVVDERMTIEEFCAQFETTYNIDLDKAQLDQVECAAFSVLFDKVVWYSPIASERSSIANYVGEEQILAAVSHARRVLAARGAS
jgi:hypothetical protein